MKKTNTARPVDGIIDCHSQYYNNPQDKYLQWIFIPLLLFGLLGISWAIPFPHLKFLGSYNSFINWASFFIAFLGYYYYRLSPVLCYGFLLLVFILSGGLAGLENLHARANWPEMWKVSLAILLISITVLLFGYRQESKKPAFSLILKLLLTAPLWLIYLIFKKGNIRY